MSSSVDYEYTRMSIENLDRTLCKDRRSILDPIPKNEIHVTALCVYPVKGCKGFSVNSWPITDSGLYLDRHWCIYNSQTKKFFDIEFCSDSLMINTYIDLKKKLLILASPNMLSNNYIIPILTNEFKCSDNSDLLSLNIYGKRSKNIFKDCGDEVANWINDALNREDCRLLKQTELIEGNLSITACQLLLVNTNSNSDLADKIAEDQGYFTTELSEFCWRFRPSIVICGVKPYEEYKWKNISINDVEFQVVKLCQRCPAVNIDLERLDYEKNPLDYLRKTGKGKAIFGIYFSVSLIHKDILEVGNEIRINVSE